MDIDMAITPTTSYSELENTDTDNNEIPFNKNSSNNINNKDNFLSLRNRTDSLISVDTTYTVRTNVEQTYLPNNPHLNFQRNRQNSLASISSSVFSEMPAPEMENYQFTSNFDDELYGYYVSYSQQPNITPFDIRFPPSGILSLISKSFLEILLSDDNKNRTNDYKILIDSRPDVNLDLLSESNRHACLAVIRLRLIKLCNMNLNSNDDQFMYNDQLPISRTNSIASAISFSDRVLPNMSLGNNNNSGSNDQNYQQIPPPMAHRPSWLHMPNLSTANNQMNHLITSSTDSLIDRVQLNNNNNNNNNNSLAPSYNTLDGDNNESFIFSNQQTSFPLQQSSSQLNSNTNSKRERPTLNLHMPPLTQARSHSHSHQLHHLPRPMFSTGPVTPGTPGTPNTPLRNPRGLRSTSLSNNSGSTYFNMQNLNVSNSSTLLSNINSNNTTNNNNNNINRGPYNPASGHLQTPNNNFQSPIDLQSPFEQAFPSPLGVPSGEHNINTYASIGNVLNNNNNNNTATTTTTTTTTTSNGTTTPNTTITNSDLYNATAARKRDSLKLKRGLN